MHALLHLSLAGRPSAAFWALLVADLAALLAVPSVLLRKSGRPLAALGWLLGVLSVPYLGVLAWIVIGRDHLERPRRALQRARDALCGCREPSPADAVAAAAFERIVPARSGLPPPSSGNRVRLLVDGDEAFGRMEAAIAGAAASIEALFYVWKADATGQRLTELLAARARAGVEVRVLLDGVGSFGFLSRHAGRLREAGAHVAPFLPIGAALRSSTLNLRNHRKILVVDGGLAFTGGMNVGDEYAQRWHDVMLEIDGPAAAQLRGVFLEDWAFAASEVLGEVAASPDAGGACVAVVPSGPDTAENAAHDLVFLAVVGCRERAWLMTPYFVPPPALAAALRTAALRGADVRLLIPARPDVWLVSLATRPYLEPLLRAGVRLFAYGPRGLHGKAMLIDGDLSIVGSANADARSFRLNFETTCAVRDAALAAHLEAVFEDDFAHATELGVDELGSRSAPVRILESVAHLLSPLL